MNKISESTTATRAVDKRAVLAELLRRKISASAFPMSHAQRMMWFLQQLDPSSAAYNTASRIRLAAAVEPVLLERALAAVQAKHPILQTTYALEKEGPLQRIQDKLPIPIERRDGRDLSSEELHDLLGRNADRPFHLASEPPLRVFLVDHADGGQTVQLTFHHIAFDLWSMTILHRDLMAAMVSPGSVRFEPSQPTFRDYVEWEQKWLESPAAAGQLEFWRDRLAPPLPIVELPADRSRPAMQSYRGATHRAMWDATLTQEVRSLAAREHTTPFVVMLSAFVVLVHRLTGQSDLIIGTPTAGRNRPEWSGILGNFSNPIALRIEAEATSTFRDLIARVRHCVLESLERQDYPFAALVDRLSLPRDPSRSPIFSILFAWEKLHDAASISEEKHRSASPTLQSYEAEQRGAAFDLVAQILDHPKQFHANFQYNTDLFDASTIERWAGHLSTILDAVLDDPERRIGEVPLLTPSQREQILYGFNATKTPLPYDSCLHWWIEDQVDRTPANVAVRFMEESGSAQELTFRELNEHANRLAHYLQSLGVTRETLVGVSMDRSIDLVVALVGILKAGGAYVPLDPDAPAARLSMMLSDTKTPVVLTQKHFAERFVSSSTNVLAVDELADVLLTMPSHNPERNNDPGDAAYAIYTSGSTGVPKAAVNEHRGISNRILWMQARYCLDETDRVVQKTPFTFDVSVWEFFWPLIAGARLVLAKPGGHRDSGYLARLFADEEITTCHFVPSMLSVFLEEDLGRCRSLRRVICSGEALSVPLRDRFFERLDAELHNLYGPTEAAVDVTFHECRPNEAGPTVPIGRPIANMRTYVLDERREPVPLGVAGELYLGGVGVARGYLNRPELTSERFLVDPFVATEDWPRWYRTGDLARYRPDGAIEFLGRLDHQVKIAGFRIELGEIETVLGRHPGVKDVVVVDHEFGPHDRRLVAYVCRSSTGGSIAHGAPSSGSADDDMTLELRAHAARELPSYMVPAVFEYLDELPLSSNGKVDRRQLPAPSRTRMTRGRPEPPRNDIERQIAQIWAEVLGIEPPSMTDNFFELGGASLPALRIVHAVNRLGLPMTPEMLFRHPTVRELADELNRSDRSPQSNGQANGMLVHRSRSGLAAQRSLDSRPPRDGSACSVIESLGCYLPQRRLTTQEVLRGCRQPLDFPLERLTGIRARRAAGNGEYSIDLAREAIRDCLAGSRYSADEIDMLVCCNISRYDGPNLQFVFEPATAARLAADLGLTHAVTLDISNACAGMFTGVHIVDVLIKSGAIRNGLVVSGEYITHLIQTAQREIEGFLDPRLACLTVGDAGAAVLLEPAAGRPVGFEHLELFTLGKYSRFCIGKLTSGDEPGAIMLTDMLQDTAVSVEQGVRHATRLLERRGWKDRPADHVLLHQTSQTALDGAMQEFNRALGRNLCTPENMISNLLERGNTASTAHFVALADKIESGRIHDGQTIVFGISASGKTTGTGLYTLDDLPSRLRARRQGAAASSIAHDRPKPMPMERRTAGVKIVSLGSFAPTAPTDTQSLIVGAVEDCLGRFGRDRNEIDLFVHAGVYRSEYICEPALAALAAGTLSINHEPRADDDRSTFVFDVINGGTSFLSACHIAIEMLRAERYRTVLLATSEVENNREIEGAKRLGLAEVGSAVILERSKSAGEGFSSVYFYSEPRQINARRTYTRSHGGQAALHEERWPDLEDRYIRAIGRGVRKFLDERALSRSDISFVVAPQISRDFLTRVSEELDLDPAMFVDATREKDLFTASTIFALQRAEQEGRATPGTMALVVEVGSGIQVACATYRY